MCNSASNFHYEIKNDNKQVNQGTSQMSIGIHLKTIKMHVMFFFSININILQMDVPVYSGIQQWYCLRSKQYAHAEQKLSSAMTHPSRAELTGTNWILTLDTAHVHDSHYLRISSCLFNSFMHSCVAGSGDKGDK